MRGTNLLKIITFSSVLANALASHAAEKIMYRWVDEHGKVYFSDVVPPDQIKHKREARDENARVLDVVDKAKTSEELAELKRLEALRQEQKKLIAQQQTTDKTLLSTYRSVDDMRASQKNRLAGIENEKKLLQGLLERYQNQLQQQQQQAAEEERNARPVPQKLIADIASSKQQIETTNQEIIRQGALRQQLEKEFTADIARYQVLTQESEQSKTQKSPAEATANLGLFVCESTQQCEQAWRIAAEYADKNSTTKSDVSSEKLIMRAAPMEDHDISLSISKLDTNNQTQLFLDVRCKSTPLGAELCNSSKVQSIRQNFVPFLQNRLASQH